MLLFLRLSGGMFSWLEERQSDSKAAIEAKKAQWKKELGTYSYSHTRRHFKPVILMYIKNGDSSTREFEHHCMALINLLNSKEQTQ